MRGFAVTVAQMMMTASVVILRVLVAVKVLETKKE
jgi:hypothetical protein